MCTIHNLCLKIFTTFFTFFSLLTFFFLDKEVTDTKLVGMWWWKYLIKGIYRVRTMKTWKKMKTSGIIQHE